MAPTVHAGLGSVVTVVSIRDVMNTMYVVRNMGLGAPIVLYHSASVVKVIGHVNDGNDKLPFFVKYASFASINYTLKIKIDEI